MPQKQGGVQDFRGRFYDLAYPAWSELSLLRLLAKGFRPLGDAQQANASSASLACAIFTLCSERLFSFSDSKPVLGGKSVFLRS